MSSSFSCEYSFSSASMKLAIGDDQLGGIPERRMDDGVFQALVDTVRPVDDVSAFIIDSGLATLVGRRSASICNGTGRHQRSSRPGGLSGPQLTGGVDYDPDLLGRHAQLLGGDLKGHRVDTLAHFGPRVPHLNRAVFFESDHGPRFFAISVAQA